MMAKFRKLMFLCTAILASTTMALASGCNLFEPIDSSSSSEVTQSSETGSVEDSSEDSSSEESSGNSSSEESSSDSSTPEVKTYTIKFVNEDGTVLQEVELEEGEMPEYTGATPTKAGDAQYSYEFAGWGEIVAVTGEATYTATYTQTTNKYVIKFVNADGTELQSSEVAYGEMPAYNGATPTKAADAQYSYEFAGWGELVAVTGDITYTASFTATVNKYTVTFDVDGGSAVEAQTVPYGTSAEALAMFASSKAGYIFKGWSMADGSEIPVGATVTSDITVKAIWKEIITVEVENESELLEAIALGDVNIKLIANITITTSGTIIETLNLTLDLNGYTLTRSSTNAADMHLIKTIAENGVLKNGKIDYTYRPSAATGHLAYIINQNTGLVENVEVKATLHSGSDWNNLVGLFEGQDAGVGTYRNMVVQVSDEQIQNACGVFRQVNANLTVENCIIIKNNMPFAAFNPNWGMTEQTLSNLKSSNGTILFNTIAEYTASNYDTSSFSSDYWTIDATTKLPKIKAFVASNEVEVDSEANLLAAIAQGNVNIKLVSDITITTSGTIIETLNVTLDLNGHTLTRSSTNAADMHLIKTITENGVLKNGKIDFTYRPSAATGHLAYIINQNNGLVENVEVKATLHSGSDWNNLVGLFEGQDAGVGTYRNMVVQVSDEQIQNACGVFRQVNANLTVENCIIIKNNMPFAAFNPNWGMTEQTLSNLKSSNGTILFNTIAEYTASNYDTSSFSSDYWTIDEITKLPKIN